MRFGRVLDQVPVQETWAPQDLPEGPSSGAVASATSHSFPVPAWDTDGPEPQTDKRPGSN